MVWNPQDTVEFGNVKYNCFYYVCISFVVHISSITLFNINLVMVNFVIQQYQAYIFTLLPLIQSFS